MRGGTLVENADTTIWSPVEENAAPLYDHTRSNSVTIPRPVPSELIRQIRPLFSCSWSSRNPQLNRMLREFGAQFGSSTLTNGRPGSISARND